MTVSVVQSTGQAPASSGTVSFTLGSSPAAGNVLVAFCSWNSLGRTITTPSGWTLVTTVISGTSSQQAISTFTRPVQAGDGTAWSFTVAGGTNDYTSGALYEVTGASTVFPVNQWAGAAYTSATGTFATAAATPTVLGCLPLAGWTTDSGQTFSSITSGWTDDLNEGGSFHATFAGHANSLTADTTTPVSATLTITGTDTGASQVLLIGPVPPPSPYVVQYAETLASATASVVLTLSAAPAAGNLLTAFIAYNAGGGARSVTTPSGWTKWDDTGGSSNDSLATFTRVVQSGDPAAWTFTIATSGGNDWASGELYEVTGQSTTAPVSQHSAVTYGGGTSPFTTGSVTPSVLSCLALSALTTDGFQAVSSVTSGWLADQTAGAAPGYHSSYSAHQRLLTADTTTAVSCTWTMGAADAGSSEILLIAPAAVTPAGAPQPLVVPSMAAIQAANW